VGVVLASGVTVRGDGAAAAVAAAVAAAAAAAAVAVAAAAAAAAAVAAVAAADAAAVREQVVVDLPAVVGPLSPVGWWLTSPSSSSYA
jgi:hypothetical protein